MAYQPRVVTPYMPNMLVDVLLRFALPVLLIVVGRVLECTGILLEKTSPLTIMHTGVHVYHAIAILYVPVHVHVPGMPYSSTRVRYTCTQYVPK